MRAFLLGVSVFVLCLSAELLLPPFVGLDEPESMVEASVLDDDVEVELLHLLLLARLRVLFLFAVLGRTTRGLIGVVEVDFTQTMALFDSILREKVLNLFGVVLQI